MSALVGNTALTNAQSTKDLIERKPQDETANQTNIENNKNLVARQKARMKSMQLLQPSDQASQDGLKDTLGG